MDRTAITAHSGCDGTDRDSLASVEQGITLGADCVEVDVRMDAKGRLRLSHDARADYQGAACLEDALRRAAEAGIRVNCDLKQPSALYPTLLMADRCGLSREQLVFSGSVSLDLLAADAAVARRAQVYLNIEEMLKFLLAGQTKGLTALLSSPWSALKPQYAALMEDHSAWLADMALDLGAAAINMPYQGVTERHIAFFRARGIGLSLWTVNHGADMELLLAARPQNITTLHVKDALSLRAAIQ